MAGFRSEFVAQEFHLPTVKLTGVPEGVLSAAFGAQKPVTPHAQRILVAAKKAFDPQPCKAKLADPQSKAAADDNSPSSKTDTEKPTKKKPGPKPKVTEAPKPKREKYPDTAYNIARKAYFSTFLDYITT